MRRKSLINSILSVCIGFVFSIAGMDGYDYNPDKIYKIIKRLKKDFFTTVKKTDDTTIADPTLSDWFSNQVIDSRTVRIPNTNVFLVAELDAKEASWYLTLYAYNERDLENIGFPVEITSLGLLKFSNFINIATHPLIKTLQKKYNPSTMYMVGNNAPYIEGHLGIKGQECIYWRVDNRKTLNTPIIPPNITIKVINTSFATIMRKKANTDPNSEWFS